MMAYLKAPDTLVRTSSQEPKSDLSTIAWVP